jgi:hypothetical protein
VPGDHNLPGRIEIHRLYHLALRGLLARRAHGGIVEIEDRRHRSLALGHRLLHRLRPEANQRQAVAKSDRPGRHQRGVLAEAVPGDDLRARPA